MIGKDNSNLGYYRMAYIDAIRGISCILVFICHWFGTIGWENPNYYGKTGVCFLLSLSGYCLMKVYHKDRWNVRRVLIFI